MSDATESSADEESPVGEEYDASMGFPAAAAIGVGTMIAAGIFVLSGLAVSNVGAAAIVSFLLAAAVASLTAASYAEFASMYPSSGGGYVYVARTVPTDLSYLMGWTMILGYPASAAFYLASFADWFYRFIYPALNVPEAIPFWVSGVAVLGLLAAVNLKGTEETGMFQVGVTSLKVVLIGVFLYGGFQAFDASAVQASLTRNLTEFRNIGVTSALVFITFFGFSAIATDAEEIADPGDTIPKAIYFSMGFVTVVYALVVLVVVTAVNDASFLSFLTGATNLHGLAPAEFVARHGELAMGLAARYYLGDVGFYVIIVGALLSMLSAANATILAGSRVKLAMAREGHLPEGFEDLHPSLDTPWKAVLLTAGFILAFMVVFTVVFRAPPGAESAAVPLGLHLGLESLAQFANFMLIVGLSIVNLALVRSRREHPDADRDFEVPGVPWVPAVAVVGNLALLYNVGLTAAALGVVAEVIGVAFWFAWQKRATSTEKLEAETPTALHRPASTPGVTGVGGASGEDTYRLVVAIANPDNVEQLMRTATGIARDRDGDLLVTSAVVLPEQTPYVEGHATAEDREAVIERALAVADDEDVPATGTVRVTRAAADAILNTVEQYDADAVLLGWGGDRPASDRAVLGSTVDEVAREADADVLTEEVGDAPGESTDSILVPTTDDTHTEFAAETAAGIGRTTDADVTLVHVVPPDADDGEREHAETVLAETADRVEATVDTAIVGGDDVAGTLVEESVDHDLTVVGASTEGPLEKLVFGSVPEAVGDRARNTVILAQRGESTPSRLRRWLGLT